MDEVFGRENFVVLIAYKRLGSMLGARMQSSAHYLVWCGRNLDSLKQRKLFQRQVAGIGTGDHYTQTDDGGPYQLVSLATGGYRPNTTINYDFEGRTYHPGANKCWRTLSANIG